jgi:hypothetical protein
VFEKLGAALISKWESGAENNAKFNGKTID